MLLYYVSAVVSDKDHLEKRPTSRGMPKRKQDAISTWEGKILRNLEVISESKMLKKRQEENRREWKVAGAALDRLCIVLFLITIIATLGFVFNTAPQITL